MPHWHTRPMRPVREPYTEPPGAVWHPIEVAPGAGPLGAYVLDDPDALLDRMDDATFAASDERMPYYALLWPAGEALARAVAEGPALGGRAVLDLGCGCGAAGLAAARRGAEVTCLDWAPEAQALVEAGAERLGLRLRRFVACDWRDPPPLLGCYYRILAADVLYEERNAVPVARFLAQHLTDDGEAWITDPGRRHAEAFPTVAAARGLTLVEARALPALAESASVRLFRLRRG